MENWSYFITDVNCHSPSQGTSGTTFCDGGIEWVVEAKKLLMLNVFFAPMGLVFYLRAIKLRLSMDQNLDVDKVKASLPFPKQCGPRST